MKKQSAIFVSLALTLFLPFTGLAHAGDFDWDRDTHKDYAGQETNHDQYAHYTSDGHNDGWGYGHDAWGREDDWGGGNDWDNNSEAYEGNKDTRYNDYHWQSGNDKDWNKSDNNYDHNQDGKDYDLSNKEDNSWNSYGDKGTTWGNTNWSDTAKGSYANYDGHNWDGYAQGTTWYDGKNSYNSWDSTTWGKDNWGQPRTDVSWYWDGTRYYSHDTWEDDGSRHYAANLTGWQEVPPVSTNTTGSFHVMNKDAHQPMFELAVFNGKNITEAHLHCAPVGKNGPVVYPLYHTAQGTWVHGILAQGTLEQSKITTNTPGDNCPRQIRTLSDLKQAMDDGLIYANVHSVDRPAGLIRGQVMYMNNWSK